MSCYINADKLFKNLPKTYVPYARHYNPLRPRSQYINELQKVGYNGGRTVSNSERLLWISEKKKFVLFFKRFVNLARSFAVMYT